MGRSGCIVCGLATAPHREHVGVGGITECHEAGTVTNPPHRLHLPTREWPGGVGSVSIDINLAPYSSHCR